MGGIYILYVCRNVFGVHVFGLYRSYQHMNMIRVHYRRNPLQLQALLFLCHFYDCVCVCVCMCVCVCVGG